MLHVKPDTYRHLQSSLRYSSQALPINVLLDTLLRPYGDTGIGSESCVEWRHEPECAVDHLVLGNAPHAGGQWADNPVSASWDIGALSYAEQLSLPGYSLADHWSRTKETLLPELLRPTRTEIAEYFAEYPKIVGIAGAIRTSTTVDDIVRCSRGFHIRSHRIHCKSLVLASGVFSTNLVPPSFLKPLNTLSSHTGAVLVIGSGFTAADIIISTPPGRKIIHLFNWDPENRPSPLKGCHALAYPEYAGIYRQMKLAATRFSSSRRIDPHKKSRRMSDVSHLPFFDQRDWSATYEGIPNAQIISAFIDAPSADGRRSFPDGGHHDRQRLLQTLSESSDYSDNSHEQFAERKARSTETKGAAVIEISHSKSEITFKRTISSFHYAAGRRGSLAYLSPSLLREVLPVAPWDLPMEEQPLASSGRPMARRKPALHDPGRETTQLISGQTLRDKIEDSEHHGLAENLVEVASSVYVIGSLTGDTLIRFAFGACTKVAASILDGGQSEASAQEGLLDY